MSDESLFVRAVTAAAGLTMLAFLLGATVWVWKLVLQ